MRKIPELTIAPDKAFFQPRRIYIFLFLHENTLWYSLEVPQQGASNEYSQHGFFKSFWWRSKKNVYKISLLSRALTLNFIYMKEK